MEILHPYPRWEKINLAAMTLRIIVWYGIFQRDSTYKQTLARVQNVAVRAILMLPPPLSRSVELPMSQAMP
jgi:hypothetical protein